jgi:uncharacterized delta-60 repeat protein
MPLILRQIKGSPLTFQEMDDNLVYLESLSGGGFSYYDNGASSVNTSIDWSNASLQKIEIDNDPTLSFTGAAVGQKLTLLLKQTIGDSKRTITWADGIFWRDGQAFDLSVARSISRDDGFDIGAGFINPTSLAEVKTLSVQPDGKILVGGGFSQFNGSEANGLARLNLDGTIDGSFDTSVGFSGGFAPDVRSIALQPDGKILAGGLFTSFNGSTANRLARLNSDGTLDGGFDMSVGFNSSVNTIALQPDGKILAGGLFTSFNGSTANRLARLNSDGTLDVGFDMSTGFNSSVNTIALQPDGKILVGGQFTSFNGSTANRLARLNSDGTLDVGFDMSTGFSDNVLSIALQPDGKILVGGQFASFDGSTANRLARLNSDGTLDGGFDMSIGFSSSVYSIALQPDGKILVGGQFTSFKDKLANELARLNSDGTLDEGFDMTTGFNSRVQAIVLQPDSKILAGGTFSQFNDNLAVRLVRLTQLSGDNYTPVHIYYTGDEYVGDY